MAKSPLTTPPPDPAAVVESYRAAASGNPQDIQAQTDLGWGLYGAGKFQESLDQFQRALGLDASHIDAVYGLALAHKALGNQAEAVAAFSQVVAQAGDLEDGVRASMLRRLALGHINEINAGDWQLEAEIWKREA